MVTPVADCLHEEVSPGIVKGGIVSDEKLGIVNYGCSINPYTMWVIGVDTTGIEDWASITCKEAKSNYHWEI